MDTQTIFCSSCGAANLSEASFCTKCGSQLIGTPAPAPPAAAPTPSTPRSDFITLACPNCGGSLAITPEMDRFQCKYCGLEHLVRREGGAVSLAPVVEGIQRLEKKFESVSIGSDRAAAEQTIQRLKQEIPILQIRLAQKEQEIKAASPIRGHKFWSIFYVAATIGFYILLFTLGRQKMDADLGLVFCLSGLLLPFTALCIALTRTGRKTRRRKQAAEEARDEILEELTDSQSRLKELNEYTTRR